MTALNTEIRKLQPLEFCTLVQILNQSDSWKKLMAIVPKDTDENRYMFNNEHFTMIEQAVRQQQRSGADIFLSEWSTLNKQRPTCRILLDLLIKAKLFRAADYLAIDILQGDPPQRPKTGPAAEIDLSEKALEELLRQQVDNLQIKCKLPQDTKRLWSLSFAEKPISVSGNREEGIDNCANQSDLMIFSRENSSLIKFSISDKEKSTGLLERMSDLIKFSNQKMVHEFELGNYVLQEARSEDIPLCVRENAFQSNKVISAAIENSAPLATTDSSDITHSIIPSEQINLPNISQNVIPIVVLEYNEIDKNKINA